MNDDITNKTRGMAGGRAHVYACGCRGTHVGAHVCTLTYPNLLQRLLNSAEKSYLAS